MFNPLRSVKNSVTVATSTTAAAILTPDNNRGRAIVQNVDASIVIWVGDANVTSSNGGVRLAAGETYTFIGRGYLYAVAASGTPNVKITSETHVANEVKSWEFAAVTVADAITRLARQNRRRMRCVVQNLAATSVTVGNANLGVGTGGVQLAQYQKATFEGTDAIYAFGTGTNELQTLTITGTPTGGTFTLTYAGQTTTGIARNAAASAVTSALEALSNIGTGNVLCGGGALPGTPVTITFQGTLANTDVALITADITGLTGGTPAATVVETTKGASRTFTVGVATEAM